MLEQTCTIAVTVQDDLQMDEFPLGEDMHHKPGPELFDFMADKLVNFAVRIGRK